MNINQFIEESEKIGIKINSDQLDKLERYYQLLIEWNKKINLTAITEKEEVYLKHFFDSLTLIKAVDLNKDLSLCDVGTGAGFPGIVLKIVFPKLRITLIDSLKKRIDFLNIVIQELDLKDIEALHIRMEDYSRNNREKFDIVTSRAVARTEILVEICIPALKVDGCLLLMKGSCDDEINNSINILKKLNSSIVKIDKFLLPYENSNRTIIFIKKEAISLSKYPRSIDKIKKTL